MENNSGKFRLPVPSELPSPTAAPRKLGHMQALMLARQPPNPSPIVYRCRECGSVYPTPQALGGHASTHTKTRRLQAKLANIFKEATMRRLSLNHVPPPPPPPPPVPADLARARERVGENYPYGRAPMDCADEEEEDAMSDDGSSQGSVASGSDCPY